MLRTAVLTCYYGFRRVVSTIALVDTSRALQALIFISALVTLLPLCDSNILVDKEMAFPPPRQVMYSLLVASTTSLPLGLDVIIDTASTIKSFLLADKYERFYDEVAVIAARFIIFITAFGTTMGLFQMLDTESDSPHATSSHSKRHVLTIYTCCASLRFSVLVTASILYIYSLINVLLSNFTTTASTPKPMVVLPASVEQELDEVNFPSGQHFAFCVCFVLGAIFDLYSYIFSMDILHYLGIVAYVVSYIMLLSAFRMYYSFVKTLQIRQPLSSIAEHVSIVALHILMIIGMLTIFIAHSVLEKESVRVLVISNYAQSVYIICLSVIPSQGYQISINFVQRKLESRLTFIRYISHEIRTPLNTVSIGLEYMKQEIESVLKNHLNVINNQLNAISQSKNMTVILPSSPAAKVGLIESSGGRSKPNSFNSCKSNTDFDIPTSLSNKTGLALGGVGSGWQPDSHHNEHVIVSGPSSQASSYAPVTSNTNPAPNMISSPASSFICSVPLTRLQSLNETSEDMAESCQTALETLNDLLTLDKLEGGKLLLELASVNPWTFIWESVKPFAVHAKSRQIHYEVNCIDADSGWTEVLVLRTDKHKLGQVLRNLISNAMKFTPPQGKVLVNISCREGKVGSKIRNIDPSNPNNVRTGRNEASSVGVNRSSRGGNISQTRPESTVTKSVCDVENQNHSEDHLSVSSTANDKNHDRDSKDCKESRDVRGLTFSGNAPPPGKPYTLVIEVVDNGHGISPRDQQRLFGQYVQFNASRLQSGQGSGLGLWISKGIVELHGGIIGVHSLGEGHGCTFFIEIPLFSIDAKFQWTQSFSARVPSSRSSIERTIHDNGSKDAASVITSAALQVARENGVNISSEIGNSTATQGANINLHKKTKSSQVSAYLGGKVETANQANIVKNTRPRAKRPRKVLINTSFMESANDIVSVKIKDKNSDSPRDYDDVSDIGSEHMLPMAAAAKAAIALVGLEQHGWGALKDAEDANQSNTTLIDDDTLVRSGSGLAPLPAIKRLNMTGYSSGHSSFEENMDTIEAVKQAISSLSSDSSTNAANTGSAKINNNASSNSNILSNVVPSTTSSIEIIPSSQSCTDKPSWASGLRILLADDSIPNQKVMRRLLTSFGHDITTADDGKQVVEILESMGLVPSENTQPRIPGKKAFDVILIDDQMPRLSGVETIRLLRSRGYRGIMIGVTGNISASDVDRFLDAGANQVFPKPLNMDQLKNFLQEALA